ncbi:hypothetical protein BG846_00211 [Streptomyces fradiae ATCC 10745 = DSM 40063]|uniref:Uncharacterized protein n=1 Tax=Streptomyces fradiae ATCC 10745 = DSM 40063 TaxID=1319510 RepID=A0A1Y2P3F3_STRFR|nr:hypothetical protein BG846_00211 [Streptomyces fradiae ATCC 10745 = DSM 40063]
MPPPSATEATTGRPAAKYEVSLDGTLMSSTEARCVTASTSAAASTSGKSASAAGGRNSRFGTSAASRPSASRWLPSPISTTRSAGSSRAAPTSTSRPCLRPMFPECSTTVSAGAQPSRRRVSSRGREGAATCDQLGTTRMLPGATPSAVTRAVKVSWITPTSAARRRTYASTREAAAAARSPPSMPLCAAAAPIRSCTTGTKGTRQRAASRAATTPPARLGSWATTASGRAIRGGAASWWARTEPSNSARRTAVWRGGTVWRLRCTVTPPRASVRRHAPRYAGSTDQDG